MKGYLMLPLKIDSAIPLRDRPRDGAISLVPIVLCGNTYPRHPLELHTQALRQDYTIASGRLVFESLHLVGHVVVWIHQKG
jgi:hypothetical protein